jgi:glycerophosphoryl diester phosphodiesterase
MKFILWGILSMTSSGAFAKESVLIIGHRGASGYRPEHTLESYRLAIEQGADFIEPDLVSTKDGVLIARHENEISGTTDVAEKYPDKKTTKIIDGHTVTGWFTEDFTFKEIKTLRAGERLPFRGHSYDFKFEIPSFEEILTLAKKHSVGVYPETKHPTYFRSIGLALEPKLIKALKAHGLTQPASPVIVQSFELSSLKLVASELKVRLIFLIDEPALTPFDETATPGARTYGDWLSPANLKLLAKTVYGIGPYKQLILPDSVNGEPAQPTAVVSDAHHCGLKVHVYTFRAEKQYLDPVYDGDLKKEIRRFLELGIDGLFTDFPDVAQTVRKEFKQRSDRVRAQAATTPK